MNCKDIDILLSEGEGLRVEFKSSFDSKVIETLVAFSNTAGGTVLLGISDSKKIYGVTLNPESVQNWLNEIKHKTSPALVPVAEFVDCKDKVVVALKVPEYPVKPVSMRSKYFKRVANSNHLMNTDEIASEYLRTINSSWDYYPDPDHGVDSVSPDKVRVFMHRIEQHTGNRLVNDPLEFLAKLEIIRRNQLTFGGFLLFARDHCLISDLQAGRFKGETTIIDSLSLNTDLFSEVEEVFNFIKKHLMVEYIFNGEPQRTERFDYPVEAIREIIVNMVVHRDYRESSGSVIKMFDDRIEFFNPGRLAAGITVQDLLSGNYVSQCRNKLIARAFKEAGLTERYGSGISRILNICKNHGITPPLFEEIFNGFRVILYKKKANVTEDVTVNVTEDVTVKRGEALLEIISMNPSVTVNEMAHRMEVTRRTILRDLEKLKLEGRIRRIGSDKYGYWELTPTSRS
ncbi:MAG: ATP-binding protein [Bacteroidales bacterium]